MTYQSPSWRRRASLNSLTGSADSVGSAASVASVASGAGAASGGSTASGASATTSPASGAAVSSTEVSTTSTSAPLSRGASELHWSDTLVTYFRNSGLSAAKGAAVGREPAGTG